MFEKLYKNKIFLNFFIFLMLFAGLITVYFMAYKISMRNGDFYVSIGNLNNAEHHYAMAVNATSLKDMESIYKLTDIYFREGEYYKAELLLNKAMIKFSNISKENANEMVVLKSLLAQLYSRTSRHNQAIRIYTDLLKYDISPDLKYNIVLSGLTSEQMHLGDLRAAERCLKVILAYNDSKQISMNDSRIYLRYGILKYKQGDYKAALKIYEDIWSYCSEHKCKRDFELEFAMNYLEMLPKTEKYDDGIKIFSEILNNRGQLDDSEKLQMYLALSAAYLSKRDKQEGLFYLQKASDMANKLGKNSVNETILDSINKIKKGVL